MERHMFRRLAFTAALSFAIALPVRAQSVAQAPASSEPAPCATLHAMMMQHAQAMGLDSAQIDSIHAVVHAAIANGASPDSVHHALLAVLMHTAGGHAAMQNHMQAMQMDSTQLAAIHACLSSHSAEPRGTER
jgi:hypothetical protein